MKRKIIEAVKNLKDDLSIDLVKSALSDGYSRKEVMEWINCGMNEVGKLYDFSEYYIADLIVAGSIYRAVLKLKEMDMSSEKSEISTSSGTILIGTVQNDIHDIGKDIFINMAKSEGFVVYDLGVDILPITFLEKCIKINPDILAMSGIITSSIQYMKETTDLITRNYLRTNLKIIIGGMKLSEEMFHYIGADFAAQNSDIGVEKCKDWIREKYERE
ncbi:MAG: cobalamin B12-binding domain-containing protein [Eubacteriales bacterium]